jgi:hypothetical protein
MKFYSLAVFRVLVQAEYKMHLTARQIKDKEKNSFFFWFITALTAHTHHALTSIKVYLR